MRRGIVVIFYISSACVALFFIASVVQASTVPTGAVIVSEIMWDGAEYLELFNTTTETVVLAGWTLTRQQAGKDPKTITQFDDEDSIEGGTYFLIEKTEEATTVPADKIVSALTLVNTGELVSLFDAEENSMDAAGELGSWFAGKNTEHGVAMERTDGIDDGMEAASWHDSTGVLGGRIGTPGSANSVASINHPPEAVMDPAAATVLVGEATTFSAEDSIDSEDEELTYAWIFGDGDSAVGVHVTHVYARAGTYTVVLTVSDGELEDEVTGVATVAAPRYTDAVVINEFLPNPIGSDTASEFIELKNTGAAAVDLVGWQLDDAADSGSKPYAIPNGTVMGAGSLRVFSRAVTKLALNNGGDSVRLLSLDGVVRSTFIYSESVAEGQSYNRTTSGSYELSTTATQGRENSITDPSEDGEEEDNASSVDTPTPRVGRVAGTSTAKDKNPKSSAASQDADASVIELKDIREEDVGTFIETEGVVSAPPGVFGEKILYLAGSGAQVYLSKEQYPDLSVGSRVKVRGEIASYLEETRIKLARAADVTVVGGGNVPEPHRVQTGEVDEDLEGTLVTISGKVTRSEGSTFYVDDDSGEVKVFIKESTKIDKPKLKKDIVVTITGVVSQTKSGYRILPRFQEDVRLGTVAGITSFPNTGIFWWLGILVSVTTAVFVLGCRAREPLVAG